MVGRKWITYINERFPIPVYLLLAGGLSLSASALSLSPSASFSKFFNLPFFWVLSGMFLFFFELRLMDELKDYKKDLVAHPKRPMPRGLLSVKEVRATIHLLISAMLVFAAFLAINISVWGGVLYLAVTIHLWLMFKEFYLKTYWQTRPLLYAISHQLILIPLFLFGAVTCKPDALLTADSYFLALSTLGAFFGYEVCRKLDPKADPILGTYLRHYGRDKTVTLIVILTAVAFYGALRTHTLPFLMPFQIALVAGLLLLYVQPARFKIVEGLATLSLLVHLWSGFIRYWVNR